MPVDRRYAEVAGVMALAVLVADGVIAWSSVTRHEVVGGAFTLILTIAAGAFGGWRLPGRRGWEALISGGAAGGICGAAIAVLVASDNPWLVLGLGALVATDVLAAMVLGIAGSLYWVWSARRLPSSLDRGLAGRLQVLSLVAICAVLFLGSMLVVPQRPHGITARNNTSVIVRFYEQLDDSWHQIGAPADIQFLPGVTGQLISLVDPSVGMAPGGMDAHSCTTRAIVARDPGGRDVALHPPGLCDGDTWVVTGPAPSQ